MATRELILLVWPRHVCPSRMAHAVDCRGASWLRCCDRIGRSLLLCCCASKLCVQACGGGLCSNHAWLNEVRCSRKQGGGCSAAVLLPLHVLIKTAL